jgi:hypothetical protein
VIQNNTKRRSAIDGRTTRHVGYEVIDPALKEFYAAA